MLVALALTLLNVGLVVAPIGGAVGTLAGIDYYRRINGQSPLFTSDPDDTSGTPGYTGGGGSDPDNFNYTANYTWPGSLPNATTTSGGVTLAKYCQQYVDINVGTKTGQNYTLNPNQWGWAYGDEGGMCLNVTTYTNMTYATNTTAPEWSVTWQYDAGPSSQPVHAFPNIMMDNDVLPVKLSKMSVMSLDVQWAYEDLGTAVIGTIKTTTTITTKKTSSSSTKATATAAGTTTKAAAAGTTTTAAAAATSTAAAAVKTSSAAAVVATTSAAAAVAVESSTAAVAAAAESSAAVGKKFKRNRVQEDMVFNVDEAAIEARAVKQMMNLAERYVAGTTFSANVAVDMFFDSDSKLAGSTSNATYEVMVWLAQFGEYTDPIGSGDGAVTSYVIDGANFTLYSGDRKSVV